MSTKMLSKKYLTTSFSTDPDADQKPMMFQRSYNVSSDNSFTDGDRLMPICSHSSDSSYVTCPSPISEQKRVLPQTSFNISCELDKKAMVSQRAMNTTETQTTNRAFSHQTCTELMSQLDPTQVEREFKHLRLSHAENYDDRTKRMFIANAFRDFDSSIDERNNTVSTSSDASVNNNTDIMDILALNQERLAIIESATLLVNQNVNVIKRILQDQNKSSISSHVKTLRQDQVFIGAFDSRPTTLPLILQRRATDQALLREETVTEPNPNNLQIRQSSSDSFYNSLSDKYSNSKYRKENNKTNLRPQSSSDSFYNGLSDKNHRVRRPQINNKQSSSDSFYNTHRTSESSPGYSSGQVSFASSVFYSESVLQAESKLKVSSKGPTFWRGFRDLRPICAQIIAHANYVRALKYRRV